jgi:hypothetical protein
MFKVNTQAESGLLPFAVTTILSFQSAMAKIGDENLRVDQIA